jgi:hypothetical protein
MASEVGRGAQVLLHDVARQAARGATGNRLIDNIRTKQALEQSGVAATGDRADGSTSTGSAAQDFILSMNGAVDGLVQSVAGLQGAVTAAQIAAAIVALLPTTLPATSGVLWNNGGMVSVS